MGRACSKNLCKSVKISSDEPRTITPDVKLSTKKYELLMKMKTEFHQVPEHLQKAYEKFKQPMKQLSE